MKKLFVLVLILGAATLFAGVTGDTLGHCAAGKKACDILQGTDTDDVELTGIVECNDIIRMHTTGGLDVYLANGSGATLTQGMAVIASTTAGYVTVAAAGNRVIGTVRDSTIAAGSSGWVTVRGLGYVKMLTTGSAAAAGDNLIVSSTAGSMISSTTISVGFVGQAYAAISTSTPGLAMIMP